MEVHAQGMPPATDHNESLPFKEKMGATLGKRKSPMELRLEQLKRHQTTHEVGAHEISRAQGSFSNKKEVGCPQHPLDDTEVPNINPSVKPAESFQFYPLRNKKDNLPIIRNEATCNQNATSEDPSSSISWWGTNVHRPIDSAKSDTLAFGKTQQVANGEGKTSLQFCSFRNVTEIASGSQIIAESSIDMIEVVKNLALRKALEPFNPNMAPPSNMDSPQAGVVFLPASEATPALVNFQTTGALATISGHHTSNKETTVVWTPTKGSFPPLDLSLKVRAHISSSESLHWCQRLSSKTQCEGLRQFTDPLGLATRDIASAGLTARVSKPSTADKHGVPFWESLHSWSHPQASLPPEVLSVIASAAAKGGDAESVFLSKRFRAWEDAFHSIYHMFRSQSCSLFYVCAQQFIAMFVGGVVGGRRQDACSAYMTRSTRGLRRLLLEQDIMFSMPFANSEASTITPEDLRELSEFEKSNPGQTRLVDDRATADNGPKSFMCFEGVPNVHRLYDFLLNHRSLLSLTAAVDVPVLHAPVPFDNASLTTPELSCRRVERVDRVARPHCVEKKTSGLEPSKEPSSGVLYTMEIKGVFPPWVVKRLCAVLQVSQSSGFEASFLTEPLTEGLNVAQEKSPSVNTHASADANNSPSQKLTAQLAEPWGFGTAVMKELKFEGGSYKVVLAPLHL